MAIQNYGTNLIAPVRGGYNFQKKLRPQDERRSAIDRLFDALSVGQYVSAGIARGALRDDMSVMEGVVGGLRAANPLGKGYQEGEHSYSQVLDDMGWQPTSTAGKVARGVVGFVGDVMLDPTTYLSGGLTAVTKGTGKVGAKATHNLAEGLTKEAAEALITKQAMSKGVTLGADDLAKEADKFVKKYNELIGIRGKADDVTLSLANAPFGKKIFGKYADKSKTLISGEALQEVGERTIAPQYAKLRDSVYGSKLGNLFSTKSRLYELSKKDPIAVYDMLKSIEHTRGITKEIQSVKKSIYDKAKKMDLTPDEAKEIIELMEDKSRWAQVKKYVKFSDTKDAAGYKKRIADLTSKSKKELDELLETKKNIEILKFAKENELLENTDILDSLREDYRSKLANLDMSKVDDEKAWKDIIESLDEEMNSLKIEEEDFINSNGSLREDVLKTYDEYADVDDMYRKTKGQPVEKVIDEIQRQGTYNEKLKTFIEKPEKVSDKHYKTVLSQLNKQGYVSIKNADTVDEFSKAYKDWTVEFDLETGKYKAYPPANQTDKIVKKTIEKTQKPNKSALVEGISNYLFGRPDAIARATYDGYIDNVIDRIRRNEPKENIIRYIEKNSDYFEGRANMIYPYIARQLEYKNWDEFYHEPMAKLRDKIGKDIELTKEEKELFATLQQKDLKRREMLRDFKSMDTEDIRKMIDDDYAKRSGADKIDVSKFDDLSDIKNATYTERWSKVDADEARRDKFNAEDKALDETVNPNTPSVKNFKTGEFDDKSVYNTVKGVANKEIYDKVMKDVFIKNGKDIGDNQIAWASLVADESEEVLSTFFKTDYENLSSNQRELLLKKSIQNVNERLGGKNFKVNELKDIDRVRLNNQLKNRQAKVRVDYFAKKVKQGATVILQDADGEEISGIVKSLKVDSKDNPIMDIVKADGTIVKDVDFKDIVRLRNDVKILSPDEIINMSKSTSKFVERQDKLVKDLEFAKSKIKDLDETYKSKYEDLVNDFTQRAEEVKNKIHGIEKSVQDLDEALFKGDISKIDEKIKDVKHLEDALNNDDAFETAVRAWIGDDMVDNIISKNSPIITKLILDNDTDVSEKVASIAKQLRADLMNIGMSEVKIGKLKAEQFDNMMLNYLPHILTPEGEKLFKDKEEIFKKMPGFGDDLGYGREYNQFSKSRTLKFIPDGNGGVINNPNIVQLNEYLKSEFGDVLKGKNAFSEDIAEIYITRALKNTDVLYDDKYMRTMMDTFGSTLQFGDKVKDGYKAVANYGEIREFVRNRATIATNLELELMRQKGLKIVSGDFKKILDKNINKTLESMGLPKQALDALATPMIELTEDQIGKIQKINPTIVKEVNDAIVQKANQSRKLQIAKDESKFLELYDKFTHIIKLNQTTVLPSFHMRNKLSNTFNNWLAIGADAVNVDFQKKAYEVMKNEGKVDGVIKITKPDGSIDSIEWSDLFNLAKEYEVVDEGFFAKDLGVGKTSDGMIKKLPPKLDPTDTKNFKLYKRGAEFGGLIENQDRLIHFASQMSRGMSPEDAAESVNKFLFDYSELTAFEKSTMKRIIPYYTWLRKNAPLQLEMMLSDPKKYQAIAKIRNGIEGMTDDEDKIDRAFVSDFAKDWVQTPFRVTNPEGREEPVLWNPNLPFMDLGRIPDITQPGQSLKELFTQVNPLIKTPIEQLTNHNVYFDQPIVDDGENQLLERLDHILSQNAMYPVLKGNMRKKGADLALHRLNSVSGIKMLSYDYDKYKAMKIQALLKKEKEKEEIK